MHINKQTDLSCVIKVHRYFFPKIIDKIFHENVISFFFFFFVTLGIYNVNNNDIRNVSRAGVRESHLVIVNIVDYIEYVKKCNVKRLNFSECVFT